MHQAAMNPGGETKNSGEHFVAREPEVARLNDFLTLALGGKGQICFITGDAGTGKSTLVNEFARRVQAEHSDLLIAVGVCDPQMEGGLPYAPFSEVLATITGVAEERAASAAHDPKTSRLNSIFFRSAQVVVEYGPDLIGTLLPGGALVALFGKVILQKSGMLKRLEERLLRKEEVGKTVTAGLTQDQLIEQYVNVIRMLAENAPLLLILDDLHWADNASAELLFRLVRRVDDRRVLIVGTYRQYDVHPSADDQHRPLERVLNEIKRYHGDVWLDLNERELEWGQQFVNQLVDSEANSLDEDFRRRLFAHTGGHPLFTVELLRDFQSRGIIAKDEQGRWAVHRTVDWDNIPARVEGVVASRIAGLPKEVRPYLEVASVEGEQFTAEVIAHVLSQDARELIRRLSGDLQRVHQLVEGQDVRRVGQQRISRYRFTHQLFQRYLYNSLDPVERSYMHEAVGLALEALHGEHVADISAQLARHFEIAEANGKARAYLRMAGEQAAASYANDAALQFIDRALRLTPPDAGADRFALLAERERVHDLQGKRALQREDLAGLERLANELGSTALCAQVLLRRAKLAVDITEFSSAATQAQAAISLIEADPQARAAAPELHVDAHALWARSLLLSGDVAQSRVQWDQALEAAREQHYAPGECRTLLGLGGWFWAEGDYAGAGDAYEQALRLARDIGDLRREEEVLNNLGVLAMVQQQFDKAMDFYNQAQLIAHKIGNRIGESYVLANLGLLNLESGDYAKSQTYSEQAAAMGAELDDRMVQGNALMNHGEVYFELGRYAEANHDADEALGLFKSIRYRLGEATVLSDLGRTLLALGEREQALAIGEEALAIAREIGSRHEQGMALLHLGRALAESGRVADAVQTYRDATTIWDELGEMPQKIKARAGLAQVALSRGGPGDPDLAYEQLADVVAELLTDPPTELSKVIPMWVFLACVRVLQARQDSRAGSMEKRAVAELQARAAKISNTVARRSYLENVPEHRAIQSLTR